jgi:hypothetical protein
MFIQIRFTDGSSQVGCRGINGINPGFFRNFANTDSTGYYIVSRNTSTNKQIWKNGSLSHTQNNAEGTEAFPIYIGALNNNGSTTNYTNRQYCFATLGGEVNSSTLASTLSTIINTYQTSLGRNTY